jgi:DNA polymerase III delta prime subunit
LTRHSSQAFDFDDTIETDTADPFAQLARAKTVATTRAEQRATEWARQCAAMKHGDAVDTELWERVHAPTDVAHVVGNASAKLAIEQWIIRKKVDPVACGPALMVAGPSGIGKTLLVRLLLQKHGYAVWTGRACNEFTSDTRKRTGKAEWTGELHEELEVVMSSKPMEDLTNRPLAVLIETLEGLTPTMRTKLSRVIRRFTPAGTKPRKGGGDDDDDDDEDDGDGDVKGGKKSRVPVIFTCDSAYDRSLASLRGMCTLVRMFRSDSELMPWSGIPQAPTNLEIVSVLRSIAEEEGVNLPTAACTCLAAAARGSVRAAVNALHFFMSDVSAGTRELGACDEAMDTLSAVDRLCFGEAPSMEAATSALTGFNVSDAEAITDMMQQTAPSAVDKRPLTTLAKLHAASRAADTSTSADMLFAIVNASKDFDLASAAITLGTWGVATAIRAHDVVPTPAFRPEFGRVRVNQLWGFMSKAKAARRRLQLMGVMTAPALSKDARELAAKPFMTEDDADDAIAELDDVGVVTLASAGKAGAKGAGAKGGATGAGAGSGATSAGAGGGATSAGAGSGAKGMTRAQAAALANMITSRRKKMRQDESVALGADLPSAYPLHLIIPNPFDALERANILRVYASNLLASKQLKPTQHAERKKVLMHAGLYVPEREAHSLLVASPFQGAADATSATSATGSKGPREEGPAIDWSVQADVVRREEAARAARLKPMIDQIVQQLRKNASPRVI